MSRNSNHLHHHHHHHPHYRQRPPIVVHDHDVLSGRGVNIAHHPGNERFRTLVTTRADVSYCTSYSASEKRAVAEEIIRHIKSLDPPGRFLKRDGRGQVSRGLSGPWEELSEREAVKKTCQALRDCNRTDREGYAMGVTMPEDVVRNAQQRQRSGLTGRQQAAAAAAAKAATSIGIKRPHGDIINIANSDGTTTTITIAQQQQQQQQRSVSPSVENAAEWLKKQRSTESNSSDTTMTGSTNTTGKNPNDGMPPAALGSNVPAPSSAASSAAEVAAAYQQVASTQHQQHHHHHQQQGVSQQKQQPQHLKRQDQQQRRESTTNTAAAAAAAAMAAGAPFPGDNIMATAAAVAAAAADTGTSHEAILKQQHQQAHANQFLHPGTVWALHHHNAQGQGPPSQPKPLVPLAPKPFQQHQQHQKDQQAGIAQHHPGEAPVGFGGVAESSLDLLHFHGVPQQHLHHQQLLSRPPGHYGLKTDLAPYASSLHGHPTIPGQSSLPPPPRPQHQQQAQDLISHAAAYPFATDLSSYPPHVPLLLAPSLSYAPAPTTAIGTSASQNVMTMPYPMAHEGAAPSVHAPAGSFSADLVAAAAAFETSPPSPAPTQYNEIGMPPSTAPAPSAAPAPSFAVTDIHASASSSPPFTADTSEPTTVEHSEAAATFAPTPSGIQLGTANDLTATTSLFAPFANTGGGGGGGMTTPAPSDPFGAGFSTGSVPAVSPQTAPDLLGGPSATQHHHNLTDLALTAPMPAPVDPMGAAVAAAPGQPSTATNTNNENTIQEPVPEDSNEPQTTPAPAPLDNSLPVLAAPTTQGPLANPNEAGTVDMGPSDHGLPSATPSDAQALLAAISAAAAPATAITQNGGMTAADNRGEHANDNPASHPGGGQEQQRLGQQGGQEQHFHHYHHLEPNTTATAPAPATLEDAAALTEL